MTEKMVLPGLLSNLRKYGRSGWEWEWNGRTLRTNSEGDGLFNILSNGDVKQAVGTLQFSLPKSESKAYKELVKRYSVPEWTTF
jgi:hypothetical protein